jgi:hypothetical protein
MPSDARFFPLTLPHLKRLTLRRNPEWSDFLHSQLRHRGKTTLP